MGTSAYDKFKASQQAAPSQNPPVSEYDRFSRDASGDQLKSAAALADPAQADASARIRFLQEKTGLPAEIIQRNPDEVAKRLAQSDFDLERFHSQFPNTAKWLSERQENTHIAWDDIQPLTSVEAAVSRLIQGSVVGYQQSRQGMLGYKIQQQRGKMSDEQNTELAALNADISNAPGGRGFLSYSLLSAGQIIGQMVDAIPTSLNSGLAGAAAGATAAGLAGQAGPQVLLPEEVLTVPAATLGGFAVGSTYGMAEYTRQVEAGQAYLELSKIRNDQGKPLPEETINQAATAVGMLNSLLEMGGLFVEALPFKKAVQGFSRSAVRDALTRPTMRKALVDFSKSYLSAMAAETGTEVAQEMTNVIAEEWAKTGELKTPEDREAWMERLAEIAKQTAAGMSILALPGAALHGASTAVEARRATRREQMFTALGDGIAESKTYERFPLAIQELVTAQTKDGPLANVYVPATVWNEYWQSKKIDPAEIAKRVVGDDKQYNEAVSTGGDLIIPTGRYAASIAPTDHNAFFAKELRTGPNQMSAREAKEAIEAEAKDAEIKKDEADEARQASAEKVEKGVFEQLRAVGAGETYAATNAETYRRFFTQMSRRSGLTPEQLYDRYKLSITRTYEDVTHEKAGETVLNQDDIVKQYVAWKSVLDDPEIAQPLRDIAYMRVRDLEPHARAANQAEIDKANAEYKAKTGKDWVYKQSAPRVPSHVAAAIEEFADGLDQAVGEQKVTNIAGGRVLRYTRALAAIASSGTFDDVNVFMSMLQDKSVDPEGVIGKEILDKIEPFRTWFNDANREPPKLELLQGTLDSYRLDLPAKETGEMRKGNALITERENGKYQLAVFTDDRKLYHRQEFDTKADAERWVKDRGGKQMQTQLLQEAKPIPSMPPGFHSKAERMISVKMPERATIKDIRNILADVKADERKWLGIDEWLTHLEEGGGKIGATPYGPVIGDKVPKQTVLAYMEAHRLTIKELKNQGMNDEPSNAFNEAVDAWVDETFNDIARQLSTTLTYVTPGGKIKPITARAILKALSKQRQHDYTKNYTGNLDMDVVSVGQIGANVTTRVIREFLAGSETEITELTDELQDAGMEAVSEQGVGSVPYEDWTLPGGDNYRIVAFQFPNLRSGTFEPTHEGISTENNVFAHVRLKDRLNDKGHRVLFVEEIQSDWHQAGRERGYGEEPTPPDWRAVRKRGARAWRIINGQDDFVADVYADSEEEAVQIASRQESRHAGVDLVPNAPFRNTWHEFVMKRLIRMAADGGYQSVAWTTGNQQNARYSLEKYVQRITYSPEGTLIAYKGANASEMTAVFNKNVPEEKLADYLGKDVALRLLAKKPTRGWGRMMEGEDLRVGGQGMRGFYDDILVRFASQFGKKYDATVTDIEVHAGTDDQTQVQELDERIGAMETVNKHSIKEGLVSVHSMELSPDLKKAALQNEFTLYQFGKAEKGKRWMAAGAELDETIDKIAGVIESYDNDFNSFQAEQPAFASLFSLAQQFKITTEERDLGAAYTLLASLPEDLLSSFSENLPKTFDWIMKSQPLQQDTRGRIRVDREGRSFNIELLKKADPSTFIHETGHFYLEVLYDLRDSSDEMRLDYETLKLWLGKRKDDAFTREEHETFARGFEAYLLEGKAPVPELQSAFVRFKVWLLTVYQSIQELNVQLTEEVRGVFDRMLASEKEIDTAKKAQGMSPMFTDPRLVGDKKWMSESQAKEYADAVARAEHAASEEMSSRIMKEWRREQERVYQAAEQEVRAEVQKEADGNRTVRARSILSYGRMPSGEKLPEGMPAFKLSRAAIANEFGENVLKALPKPLVWTRDEENALHHDMAADVLGFASGDELVKSLLGSDTPKKWIDDQVRERMRGKRSHLQLLTASELPVEAMKAVHNEKQAQLLHKEVEILASQDLSSLKGLIRKVTQRIPILKDVREQAQRIVSNKPVREINPLSYQRAEQTAAKAALEAVLKGDLTEATVQKQRELLNHELYRAAQDAKDEVEKIADYMQKLGTQRRRARLGLAGEKYLSQIDALRDRFDFTQLTERQLENRQTLREFLDEQADLGMDPPIPDFVKNEAFRRNYRELTLEELRGVADAAKSIDHLARLKNKLLSIRKAKDKQSAVDAMVAQSRAYHKESKEAIDFAPDLTQRIERGVRGMVAAHTKAEFLFEWLDGNEKQGPWWTNMFKPMADAENHENAMMRNATAQLQDIFGNYSRLDRATWYYKKKTFAGMGTFTKANIMAVALNWGNEYNREALMQGYGWSDGQVQQLLDTLDERDWSTVQSIWDMIDSYWPMVERLEKRLNGLAPEKVEASPFQTKHGTVRGGYYPVMFDRNLSWRQASLDAKETVRELFGGTYAHAMTKHGHTQERVGTGGKPVLLDLTVLSQHVQGVVHDLTHREAVVDVARFIETPEIRLAVERTMGTEMYRQLRPWLMNIAARKIEFLNPIERIISRARTGATVATLGLKFSSGVAQFLGATSAMNEIGSLNFASGMKEVYGKPWKFKRTWEFVTSRSEFMKDRLSNYDRDVRDALSRMNVAGVEAGPLSVLNVATVPMRNTFFMIIGFADMGVSMPTWMGAYQAALDGKVENIAKGSEEAAIDHADQAVRMTQGVGNAKDLATVQRGPEVYRAFTMFYTAFSGVFNQFAKAQNQFKLDKSMPRLVASAFLLWFIPAVLEEALLGQPPNPDDDPTEWLKWLAKVEFQYPANTVILLRDVINGMEFDYRPSAAFDAFKALSGTGKAAIKAATDQEVTKADIKSVVDAVGYFAQLPTKQVWLTMEHLFDWWTGSLDEENPAEFMWHGLVTGEPK